MQLIHSFIESLEACQSNLQVWEEFLEFIRERNFTHASYSYGYATREVPSHTIEGSSNLLHVSLAGKSWITSIDATVIEGYRKKRAKNLDPTRNYLVSPTLKPSFHGKTKLEPNDPFYDVRFEFMDHMHENGLRSFLLIPIKHLFGRNNADVSLFCDMEVEDLENQIAPSAVNECHIAALYMHTVFQNHMRHVYAEALGIKGRPYEVLQKLHAGYTNTQIGEMLGMSTPTVSFHLKELRETLDVASTREILPTALRHGILDG